jgi:hypothetical protein
MAYLIERMKEPSTWRGLILIATGLGAGWSQESQGIIVSAGVALAGVLGALLPDRWLK